MDLPHTSSPASSRQADCWFSVAPQAARWLSSSSSSFSLFSSLICTSLCYIIILAGWKWRHFSEAFLSLTFFLSESNVFAPVSCVFHALSPKSLLQAPSTLALAAQVTPMLLLLSYPPKFASAASYAHLLRWFGSNSTDLTKVFKLSSINRHYSDRDVDARSVFYCKTLPEFVLWSLDEILCFAHGWAADCCLGWWIDKQVCALIVVTGQAFPILFEAGIVRRVLRKLTALSNTFGLFGWSFTAKLDFRCHSHSFSLISLVKW